MSVVTKGIELQTRGETDVIDITRDVQDAVSRSELSSGTATVFVSGSTAGVTTIEYESGAVRDFQGAIDRIAPKDIHYYHDARWGDGNGYSHVRAATLGPSLTVPFSSKKLLLGTWQQIVLVDFDNRPRSRKIVVQLMGE
ncbi:MAG: YjbQ family protein [Candidatus Dadabacteria bacterium]|nr:YjbQ family protein [Candidatus Dadabacteria bacterium]